MQALPSWELSRGPMRGMGTDHVISGPMRGLKKTASDAANRQISGHCDSMTESAKWADSVKNLLKSKGLLYLHCQQKWCLLKVI